MEALLKDLDAAAKPLTALSGEELQAFGTPIAVMDATKKLLESVLTAAKETKAAVAERQTEFPKIVKGPMAEAKKEILKMNSAAEVARKKANGIMDAAKTKCSE